LPQFPLRYLPYSYTVVKEFAHTEQSVSLPWGDTEVEYLCWCWKVNQLYL